MTSNQSRKDRVWEIIEKYSWIPFTNMDKFIEDRDYLTIIKGEGIYLEDIDGNRYIDALGGIYCANLGYNNKEVVKAIKEQADTLPFVYYGTGVNEPMLNLCETLGKLSPGTLNRVRLELTGSDANKVAIKIARAYFREKSKNTVISLWGSYHGNTLGTLGMTGQEYYKEFHHRNICNGNLLLPPPNCYRCSYGLTYPHCNILCAKMLETVIQNHGISNVAAFIAEPILGASIIVPPDEYWTIIKETCQRYDVLLIMDEIVTGFGRTGKLFGCDHWKIEPDIMTLAKGLSSLYQPISAVIIQDYIFDKLMHEEDIRHSHTGILHPIGCAASLASINEIIKRDLAGNAKKIGNYLRQKLEETCKTSPYVGEIRGKGLHQGIELVKDKITKSRFSRETINEIEKKFRKKGIITKIKGYMCDVIFITPPLIITKDEIDIIINVILEVLNEINKS